MGLHIMAMSWQKILSCSKQFLSGLLQLYNSQLLYFKLNKANYNVQFLQKVVSLKGQTKLDKNFLAKAVLYHISYYYQSSRACICFSFARVSWPIAFDLWNWLSLHTPHKSFPSCTFIMPAPSRLFLLNYPQYTYFWGLHSSPSPCFTPSSSIWYFHPPRQTFPLKCHTIAVEPAIMTMQFEYFFKLMSFRMICRCFKTQSALLKSSSWFSPPVNIGYANISGIFIMMFCPSTVFIEQTSLTRDSGVLQESSREICGFSFLVFIIGLLGLACLLIWQSQLCGLDKGAFYSQELFRRQDDLTFCLWKIMAGFLSYCSSSGIAFRLFQLRLGLLTQGFSFFLTKGSSFTGFFSSSFPADCILRGEGKHYPSVCFEGSQVYLLWILSRDQ